jgi:hypothetical protein
MLLFVLQVGVIEDQENRERLSKLLRFYSSKCEGDNLVGLEEYVGRMKEGQKGIYYMVSPQEGTALAAVGLVRVHTRRPVWSAMSRLAPMQHAQATCHHQYTQGQ